MILAAVSGNGFFKKITKVSIFDIFSSHSDFVGYIIQFDFINNLFGVKYLNVIVILRLKYI